MKLSRVLTLGLVLAGSASLSSAGEIATDDVRIAAGNREGRASYVPWSGVWWPFSDCELAKGWNGTGDDFTWDATAKVWKRDNATKAVRMSADVVHTVFFIKPLLM